MATTDTEAPEKAPATGPTTREIELEYDGRTHIHHVKEPSPGQVQQMLGLIDAKGLGDLEGLDAERQQAQIRRALRSIRLARALAEGLHADLDEWDRLCMAVARGDADDRVTYHVIVQTLLAWNTEPEPNNREERRSRERKARRS